MKHHFFIYLIPILIFASCESVLEVKLPEETPKLVLNTILIPDSNLYCQVSKSQNILDDTPLENINNATITIQRNGQPFTSISTVTPGAFGDSFYKSDIPVVASGEYTFTVTAPGSDAVTAKASIPGLVPINTIDTSTILFDGESRRQVAVHFNDPDGINYYQILLYSVSYVYVYDGMGNLVDSFPGDPQIEGFSTNDVQFGKTDYFGDNGAVFSDETFNGRNYIFNVLPESKAFVELGPQSFYQTFIVQLNSISHDYFLYLKSSMLYQNSNGNPFAQPVQVYSNIEGGYGIVGAQHSSSLSFEL